MMLSVSFAALCCTSIVPPGVPFEAMVYNSTVYDAFAAKTCLNPPTDLMVDPYKGNKNGTAPAPIDGPDAVCAVVYTNETRSSYRLASFENIEMAQASGGFVTHQHGCGHCSSLADLATYMRVTDLTKPIRACGFKHLFDKKLLLECIIKDTGLSEPCAQIFYYNSINTKDKCLTPCMEAEMEGIPNNLPPDNRLNDCLQCDEDKSGPIFKYYAGRTRRGSGLNSSIIRPANQVYRIIHDYY